MNKTHRTTPIRRGSNMDLGREFNSRGLRRRNRKMGFDCCRNNYVKMKPAPFNVVLVGFVCCYVLDRDKKKKKRAWRVGEREEANNTHAIYTLLTNQRLLLLCRACVCACILTFDFNSLSCVSSILLFIITILQPYATNFLFFFSMLLFWPR